jgi:hypothetical protein
MLLDVISTKIALSQGHNEQNPIMQGIVNNTIIFVLLKLSISGVIIIMIKKCIEQDRKTAINGMRILTAFMLLVVLGNFSVIVGSAESGTLKIDASTGNTYSGNLASSSQGTFNFAKFGFDVGSYTSITSMRFQSNGLSFTTQGETSSFSIISGGTGTGTFLYDNPSDTLTWYFNDANITSSPVILSYSNSAIMSHISHNGGLPQSGATLSVTQPVYFYGSSNDAPDGCLGAAGGCTYGVNTRKTLTNGYIVSYSGNPIIANVTINKKLTTVNTKIIITNSTGTKFTQAVDNTNLSYAFLYDTGIALRMNDSMDNTDYIIVNSTNSTFPATPATPEIREYPITGANIYTDKASYVVGDNVYVEWFIADTPYNNLLSHCEFIVNDEIVSQNVQQHDNYTILKPSIGTYKLQIGCGILSSTIAGETDVRVIVESQSYITIQNGTAKAGSLNNFTYKWGFTPSTYRWLNIYKFDVVKNTWVKESSNSIQLASTANVIYTSQALIKSDGKYYAEICDNNRGCPTAKILFDSTYEANVPIYSYGFSNISILNAQASYAQNDWLSFNTRIDGVNFSSGKSFSVRLYNPATTTTKTLQYIHNENENNNVYLDSAMESGAQSLQLVGTNASGTYVLNQTSIIISLLDANGYALYADKYNNVCPKEPVIITAISPTNSILTIATVPIRYYNFTGSKTIEIRGTSDYTVSLDTLGKQQKLISIFFNTSCILNPVVTPETPSAPQTMNNIMTFINLPAFWGILIFVFVVITVAWKAPSAVGIVALIISNLEAIIGLWSPYTIYVFIVTWIIAAIFFTLGRDTTTGGNK